MKNTMKFKPYALFLCALLALTGCQAADTGSSLASTASETTSSQETAADTTVTVTATTTTNTSDLFSDRDLDGSYDESTAVQVILEGDSVSCDSDAVALEGTQILLQEEGVYVFSGTLEDGQIVVNADETAKVQIVLDGAQITSSTSAAVYALEADKVFLTLAQGTENSLSNGGEYVAIDDNNIDAVVFAKTDLTLNGSGSLTINAPVGHGVVSKDDLVITQGEYTITGGTFTMDTVDDCLHAGGDLTISSGEFTLSSGDDAVHSDGAVSIADGTFTIPYCYEGIEGASITIDGGTFDITSCDDGLNAAGGADSSGFGGRSPDQFTANADVFIIINGGTFTIVSEGDCVDSNGDLTINGGTLDLTCNGNGDTALDTDGTYTNNGGDVTTNDGSESNPGGMPGGQGGGQFGGRQPGEGQFDGGQPPEGQPGGGELPDQIPEEGMEPPSTL